MLKQVLVIAAAGALILAAGHAASPDSQIIIPAHQTNPTDGQQMFVSYCAPCHGADGRGSGPVAGALKARPSDLTLLTKNNQGKYPDSHVYTVLEFGSAVPAHGTAQMPVWGTVLGRMDNGQTLARSLRISNLSRYLETMQAK